jgi:tetratricopeptide (TPR) repeat protein
MPAELEVITRLDSTSGLSLSKLHATTDQHSSMHCLRVPACFAVFFGVVATWSLAEETESELTADEFVVNAGSLYANGKYSEAAELYQRFIVDFGSSPDAETAIRQAYYPLAMCLLRLQRFPEGYHAIKDALYKNLDLDRAQAQELLFWKGVCELNQQAPDEARKTLEEFLSQFPPALEGNAGDARQFPSALRIPEARLLIGTMSPPGGESGRGG